LKYLDNDDLRRKILSKIIELKYEDNFEEKLENWYVNEILPIDKRSLLEIVFEDRHFRFVDYGKRFGVDNKMPTFKCDSCLYRYKGMSREETLEKIISEDPRSVCLTPSILEDFYKNNKPLYWNLIDDIARYIGVKKSYILYHRILKKEMEVING
tara:strand:+ start:92 stop:556 length:465 start_codon:yes stop_codon:yes gene_type:complete